jgi:hypothetical protein
MTRSRFFVILLASLAIASAGCGPKPAPVEGTVTKDGKPLAGVIVEFHADPDFGIRGPRSTSEPTNEAGHFRMRTDAGHDGVAVGHWRVCLLDTKAIGAAFGGFQIRKGDENPLPKGLKAAAPSRLPPKYGSLKDTPLRIEVQSGSQVIDLEVK